ncbi:MAG TPA: hypothetical protein VKT72_07770 [Candidatus Baltobacteraceae bacterium]|nr:hypothetical protein [Candidatus Baltobacteraceae bacterium]
MKRYVPVVFAAGALLLAACGGGGGGGITPPSGGGGSTPSPAPTQTPSTTNASGIVVDDKTGSPLSGVKVVLMPWAPCGATPSPVTSITPGNDGCPTPLPSPQATTNSNGAFTLNGAANGHYLLVIGNDVTYTPPPGYAPPSCTNNCGTPTPAPFTVQAVVHDNVTLTGGNQTLKAPTLPSNAYYAPPAWETNGDYRLATLDASTEMPCYIAWEYERAQNSLPGSSVDEWLTENIRSVNFASQQRSGAYSVLSVNGTDVSGGTSCNQNLVDSGMFAVNTYATDPRTIWFGGQYLPYNPNVSASAVGAAEFPIDPRANKDPNQLSWP